MFSNPANGTWSYDYDGASRLELATGPNAAGAATTYEYAYDGGGNRTLAKETTGSVVKNLSTTYDAAGLPTSATDAATGETTTYAHDAVGNLTGIDSSIAANDWTYAFDAFSRTTCAVQGTSCASGSTRVLFTLDALDRARTRSKGSTTKTLTYRGIGEQLAKTVQGSTTTTYVSTIAGAPLAEKTGSTSSFYLRDPHGDVVGLASTAAANQGTASFDPWGRSLATTGTTSFLGHQGDITDPDTKQVDMGTRWYAAGLGRFSSRDVLFGELTSPMTLNQHVYGGLNPITMWDPTGMGQCSMVIGGCRTTTKDGTIKAVGGNPGDPDHPMHDTPTVVVSAPNPRPPEPIKARPDGTVLCSHGGAFSEDSCASFDFDVYEGDWYRTCDRVRGCREIAGAPRSFTDDLRDVAHWGYSALLFGGRCIKYAVSCIEDFSRVAIPMGAFAAIISAGVALGVAGCVGTAAIGCGPALVGGFVISGSGIALTLAYWDAMLSDEHKPFDYSHCDPMPDNGTWRPWCHGGS